MLPVSRPRREPRSRRGPRPAPPRWQVWEGCRDRGRSCPSQHILTHQPSLGPAGGGACVIPLLTFLPWGSTGLPAPLGVWDLPFPCCPSGFLFLTACDAGVPWQPLHTLLTATWDQLRDTLPSVSCVAQGPPNVPCQSGDGDACGRLVCKSEVVMLSSMPQTRAHFCPLTPAVCAPEVKPAPGRHPTSAPSPWSSPGPPCPPPSSTGSQAPCHFTSCALSTPRARHSAQLAIFPRSP